MRIIKKKNQDLELKSQQVTDFEEQNSKMKTEIDELKSSLIKAQKVSFSYISFHSVLIINNSSLFFI